MINVGRRVGAGYVDDALVAAEGMAELIGVQVKSLYVYRSRGVLPDPAFTVSGVPLWWVSDVLEWDGTRRTR